MYDITGGLSSVLGLLISAISFCFSYLDSFVFNGVSLLDFIITILILGSAVGLLIGITKSGISTSERYYKTEKSKAERRKSKKKG